MSGRSRATPALLLAHVGLVGPLLALLVLAGLLPGGWRLANWIEPAHERRAREVALHAHERLALFAREVPAAREGAVVFLGSSTIERMPLAELFPGRKVLQRGIARADCAELRALLPALLPASRPAGVVLYAGSIDWRENGVAPDAAAAEVDALLAALHERLPTTPVLVLGVASDRELAPEARPELERLNLGLATRVHRRSRAGQPIAFLPLDREPLSSPDGRLAEKFSSDRYHLNKEGYLVVADWILSEGGALALLLAP